MPRKKSEEYQPWLNPRLHVWRNKVGELTVINLRSADVDLGPVAEPGVAAPKPQQEPAKKPAVPAVAADAPATQPVAAALPASADPCIVAAVKSTSVAETAPAEVDPVSTLLRQFMAKNEQSKRQSGLTLSANALGETKTTGTTTAATSAPVASWTRAAPTTAVPAVSLAALDAVAKPRQPSPAASAAVIPPAPQELKTAPAQPSPTAARAPDLLARPPSSTPVQFEFVSGTNIPGRGMVINNNSPPLTPAESPPPSGHGVALFHDPLWGDIDSSLLSSTAAAATRTSQPNASQTLLNQSSQPFLDFGMFQASQGMLTSSTAAPLLGHLPVQGARPTTAAFQTLPTGYPATAAPQMATAATIQQLTGLSGLPMAYMQATNPPAMMPFQYIYGGDTSHATPQTMVLQNTIHAPAAPQTHVQPLRVGVSASASPAPSAGGSSSPAGSGPRAGTNIEAQPFVPGRSA